MIYYYHSLCFIRSAGCPTDVVVTALASYRYDPVCKPYAGMCDGHVFTSRYLVTEWNKKILKSRTDVLEWNKAHLNTDQKWWNDTFLIHLEMNDVCYCCRLNIRHMNYVEALTHSGRNSSLPGRAVVFHSGNSVFVHTMTAWRQTSVSTRMACIKCITCFVIHANVCSTRIRTNSFVSSKWYISTWIDVCKRSFWHLHQPNIFIIDAQYNI